MARLLLFSLLFLFPFWGTYQPQEAPSLDSPRAGQVLQGMVEITGSTGAGNFDSGELSFAYDTGKPDTWFWIADVTEPVSSGSLAGWDTTDLTDGDYRLRLLVKYSDGSSAQADVRGLRVRNNSPVETDTPAPLVEAAATSGPGEPATTPISLVSTPAVQATAATAEDGGIFGTLRWLGYAVLALAAVGGAAFLWSMFARREGE